MNNDENVSPNSPISISSNNGGVSPTASGSGLQNRKDRNDEDLRNDENAEPGTSSAYSKIEEKVSKTKLKVKIRGWNGVGVWKWVANDDTCGICRVAFDGCCPDCKLPGDDCPLVWGTCTHCFHIHCIMKWLNSQQAQHLCPMCRQNWKFKE